MCEKLDSTFSRYRSLLRTKTQDCSAHGFTMLQGYLFLETDRNYDNISKTIRGPTSQSQDLQQFMSDSTWDTSAVFKQARQDIGTKLDLAGGMLNFDESGDECSGKHKAGSARQYIGRAGKTDLGQVGVLSSYSKDGVWLLIDAELYLPAVWLAPVGPLWTNEEGRLRVFKQLRIPAERKFKTKIELAMEQFDRSLAEQLAFASVGGDSFYGRSTVFRRHVASKACSYLFCIPKDCSVWLHNPIEQDDQTDNLVKTATEVIGDAKWESIDVRGCERGILRYEHAFVRVWTKDADTATFTEELLVARRENNGSISFALSNALQETHQTLALWRAERYFVERTFQDCKSELGWDELQARKYPAYMHTLALCAIALVFMADIKIEQRSHYAPPQKVKEELDIPSLPDLSLSNVKELLRAVFPLPQLSKEEAVEKVVQILWKRAKSTESRHRKNSS